jgi:hypothetical protein
MLNKEPSPERARLGFEQAVLSGFKSLEDFGLRPVEREITLVRYESSDVFVNVYHGRTSFELGVEIGLLREPDGDKLNITDIITWAGVAEDEGFGQHVMFQVSSPEGVSEFVPKLARLVCAYGIPFLKGDATAYQQAREMRARVAAGYVKDIGLRGLRRKAEAAWRAKDYAQVVEIYGPIYCELSEVEAKKLAYAEQQVQVLSFSKSPSLH